MEKTWYFSDFTSGPFSIGGWIKFIPLAVLIGFYLLWFPGHANGEYYQYTDRDGNRFYVDDPGKIPPEYADQIKIHKDRDDHLSDEEKSRLKNLNTLQEQINRERLQQHLEKEKERQEAEKRRQEQIAREQYEQRLETDVIVRDNRVLVPATIGNSGREIEVMLLLDTGASTTVLHQAAVQSLNLGPRKKFRAQVAGGRLIPAYQVELAYLQIGPIRMEQARVMVIEHQGASVSHQGLLGMNFLRQIDYTIDFENQKIKWRP